MGLVLQPPKILKLCIWHSSGRWGFAFFKKLVKKKFLLSANLSPSCCFHQFFSHDVGGTECKVALSSFHSSLHRLCQKALTRYSGF